MRNKIHFFVSYAQRNRALANDLLERLQDVLAPSKKFEYMLWRDTGLQVGAEWEKQIITARDECDFGLLLVSPAFLASRYITEKELPVYVSGERPSVPVMLQRVDFARHDLKGLEKRQIFQLDFEGFKAPRAYGECRKQRRDDFVLELFRVIENRLLERP